MPSNPCHPVHCAGQPESKRSKDLCGANRHLFMNSPEMAFKPVSIYSLCDWREHRRRLTMMMYTWSEMVVPVIIKWLHPVALGKNQDKEVVARSAGEQQNYTCPKKCGSAHCRTLMKERQKNVSREMLSRWVVYLDYWTLSSKAFGSSWSTSARLEDA